MKKILILGASEAQLDLIHYCKKYGLEVHVCAPYSNEPGVAEADYFVLADVTDFIAIKGYMIENSIKLIYSVGSNLALITIYLINKELELPGFHSKHNVINSHYKDRTRLLMGNDFNCNPKWLILKQPIDIYSWNIFPCIIKPVDNSGQKGVFVIHSRKELKLVFSASLIYSKKRELIVEEFIEGPELSVHVYLVNNNIVFFHMTDRIYNEKVPFGIALEQTVPSFFMNYKDSIQNMITEICLKLKISNGPVYMQMKLGSNGIKLIEVTPRIDGCHLWRLILMSTGVNLIKMTIDHLLEGIAPEKLSWSTSIPLTIKYNYYNMKTLGAFTFEKEPIFTYSYHKESTVATSEGFRKIGYSIFKI